MSRRKGVAKKTRLNYSITVKKAKPVLLYGDERFLVEEAFQKQCNAYQGSEVEYYHGQFDLASVSESIQAQGLFSGQKLLCIKDPFFLSKAVTSSQLDVLATLLDAVQSSPHHLVIVYYATVDRRKKVAGLLKKYCDIHVYTPFKEWEGDKFRAWAQDRVKQMDLGIDIQALCALEERVANQCGVFAQELEKMSLFLEGRRHITLSDVKQVCLGPSGSFYFFNDALKRKDEKKLLSSTLILLEHGVEPLLLMGSITATMRLYYQMQKGYAENQTDAQLAKLLGKHPFFLKQLKPFVQKHYSLQKIRQVYFRLAEADYALKSGKQSANDALMSVIPVLMA